MESGLLALLIGIACGLGFGYFTARASATRDTIHGGSLAGLFHYIGAAAVSGTLPVVLANIILGQGFVRAVLTAVAFFLVAFIALVGYAVFELPEREKQTQDDSGWTKEDALTSRL